MKKVLQGRLCYKGERGFSAYDIAVKNGFKGTEQEWLETLGVNISNVIDKDSTNATVPSSKAVYDFAVYDFINTIYPVGSIYMSVSGTNPSVLFGGTWEQIKDTFLLSAGDEYEAGSIGGEKEHVLTLTEMPNHRHGVANYNENGAELTDRSPVLLGQTRTGWEGSAFTSYEGGGKAHNNMPPYLTVYMWKRTS